jgi:hypothetical protein
MGWLIAPWLVRYTELSTQLRDRGTVAVAGGLPWGFRAGDATLTDVNHLGSLSSLLNGHNEIAASQEVRRQHLDGLVVRTNYPVGPAGSVVRSLSDLRAQTAFTATWLDQSGAVYEPREAVVINDADARRIVTVARLVLSGAVAPSERIFPEDLRRARPVEVALMLRDGHSTVLWRSTRGASVARAFLDVCFAVLDRWTSSQQERYGRMREALRTLSVTVAVFYDKGVLGSRSPEFLRRAADPHVWSVGYERLASWEYGLPPTPWAPAPDPTESLRTLAREHHVAAPGHLRSELTLYRFRALQLIESTPGGEVTRFDP